MVNSNNPNNPSNLNLSDSYSVISANLHNPFVTQTIEYGDFRSADPVLTEILPKKINLGLNNGNAGNYKDVLCGSKGINNINLGLISAGEITKAMSCSGLDYIQTNPNYDTLPFQTCLNKFEKQYNIPEMAFNNLLNNLPYTFNQLSKHEQDRYLKALNIFISKVENEKSENKKETVENFENETVENFENEIQEHFSSCVDSGFSLSGVLTIIIVVILIIIFLLFITKKN
jgi:hypothetical protein